MFKFQLVFVARSYQVFTVLSQMEAPRAVFVQGLVAQPHWAHLARIACTNVLRWRSTLYRDIMGHHWPRVANVWRSTEYRSAEVDGWSVPLKCCTFEIMRNQTVSETFNGVELAALFIPAGSGCFLQSGQNNLSSTFLEVWPMKCPFLLQPTAWNSTCLSEALAFCSVFCPVACEMKRQFIVNSSSDTSVYRMTGSIRRQSFSTCRRTTSESADCQWLPCSLAAWCLRAALQALHQFKINLLQSWEARWHSLSCWLGWESWRLAHFEKQTQSLQETDPFIIFIENQH